MECYRRNESKREDETPAAGPVSLHSFKGATLKRRVPLKTLGLDVEPIQKKQHIDKAKEGSDGNNDNDNASLEAQAGLSKNTEEQESDKRDVIEPLQGVRYSSHSGKVYYLHVYNKDKTKYVDIRQFGNTGKSEKGVCMPLERFKMLFDLFRANIKNKVNEATEQATGHGQATVDGQQQAQIRTEEEKRRFEENLQSVKREFDEFLYVVRRDKIEVDILELRKALAKLIKSSKIKCCVCSKKFTHTGSRNRHERTMHGYRSSAAVRADSTSEQ